MLRRRGLWRYSMSRVFRLFPAFVAKAIYNHPFTCSTRKALRTSRGLRRICGYGMRYDILSESVFSRAFAEFAKMSLGEKVHEAMVEKFATPGLLRHISRDATAIQGREKPVAKVGPPTGAPEKRPPSARGSART